MPFNKHISNPLMICFSSGKGGVGKTSLALNIAISIAQKGKEILIVDGDLGLANIDVMLGLAVETTIKDILTKGGDPLTALVYPEPNLAVLPASSGIPEMVDLGNEDTRLLAETLHFIATHFEIILIDTAAGIGQSVLWFNTFVHKNIVIMTPDPTSITDAYALMKVLSHHHGRKNFYILINQVEGEDDAKKIFLGIQKVTDKFLGINLSFLGYVPKDKAMTRAIQTQIPIIQSNPKAESALAIKMIAQKIIAMPTQNLSNNNTSHIHSNWNWHSDNNTVAASKNPNNQPSS